MANPIVSQTDTDETFDRPSSLWGREVVVGLSGTFDSTTATVRYKVGSDVCVFDQTTEPAFTQGGGVTVTIPYGATALRINTSGGGGSTSIDYTYGLVTQSDTR